MKKLFYVAVLCFTIATNAQKKLSYNNKVINLDSVELSSTKFKIRLENSGKFITKISSKQLKNSMGKSVAMVLNEVAGIEISGANSVTGQNLSYHIRGGGNQQVLIMIDGIAVSNPSSITNDYDLRLLSVNDVESIEVIRGAASALYGSGAATAVVNISLKKASKEFRGSIQASVGTNQTQYDQNYNINNYDQNISVSQKINKLDYLVTFNNSSSSGMSAASDKKATVKFKDDPFSSINALSKIGFQLNKKIHLGTFVKYDKFKTNFDNGSFTDGDNKSSTEQIRFGVNADYNYKKGNLTFKSSYGKANNNVESSYPSKSNSNNLFIDVYNRMKINKNTHFLVGLNLANESMESYNKPFGSSTLVKSVSKDVANFTLTDPYTNFVWISDFGLNLNLGARLNIHSEYNTHFVYTLNPSFNFTLSNVDFKVISSVSTAYITPSLFQLFSPNYGNKNLKPEEDMTIEGGLKVKIKKFNISTVYFYRKQSNFIDFKLIDPLTYSYGYKNTFDKFLARGIETQLGYDINKNVSLSANYSFTKVDKLKDVRIPKHKFNAVLNYRVMPKLNINLDYAYTGSRTDNFYDSSTFTSSIVTLKSYQLLSIQSQYDIIKSRLMVFGSIINIFNDKYEEIIGYSTKGTNVKLGFKFNF